VTYALVWAEPAIDAAAGFLADDGPGLAALMDRIDTLAAEPYPTDSLPLGSFGLRRLTTGRYRVLYEIVDEESGAADGESDTPDGGGEAPAATVTVIHLGRLG
jgi:mRNA interferase RelE/StbE